MTTAKQEKYLKAARFGLAVLKRSLSQAKRKKASPLFVIALVSVIVAGYPVMTTTGNAATNNEPGSERVSRWQPTQSEIDGQVLSRVQLAEASGAARHMEAMRAISDGGAIEARERPPYHQTKPGSDAPLMAIFSFLSRADNTSLNERPRAPKNTVGHDGQPIADPAADPSANAFESNPNINFEKWSDYWRKVHGVRFTYTEEKSDTSLQHLLRYDQLQRAPGGPTSANPPPYVAPADKDNRLYSGVIGHIPPYQRPKWDGVAYLQFKTPDDIGATFASAKFQNKIVPEDHAIFRAVAPVVAVQHIIVPSTSGRDAVSLIKTHTRKEGLSRADFQKNWLEKHAGFIASQPASKSLVKRYVQLHNVGSEEQGKPGYNPYTAKYDGVTVLSFASMNDVEDFLMSDSYKRILDAEKAFTQSGASEFWTSVNFNVVNRISLPEIQTKPIAN